MTTQALASFELATIESQARLPPLRNGQSHDQPSERRLSGRTVTRNGVFEANQARNVVAARQKWNEPKINTYRSAASAWAFLVSGANDVAYGALIPYIEADYGLDLVVVSIIFLSPFVGYIASAALNNYLHMKVGQRGISMLCAGCHVAAYLTIALHPPYMALVFAFMVAGIGNGLIDAALNAWVGTLASSTEVLNYLGAFYGVGAVLSPMTATALVTKAELPWYSFYYVMMGLATIELISLTWSFWSATGSAHRSMYSDNDLERENTLTAALFRMPAARASWLSGLVLLCYVGVETALGGWIVLFMATARGGEAFAIGMIATGFWLGLSLGRIGCLTIAIALGLVFLLVPQFLVSAITVALQGFFLGPLYPGVMLVISKLLPRHLQVRVFGFAAAMGGCGAALLPFSVGVLAQIAGVQVLQPTILAVLGVMLLAWLCLPKIDKRQD
ncbi:hypothetical protein ACJ41O_001677 [Fusarium nematophilum]